MVGLSLESLGHVAHNCPRVRRGPNHCPCSSRGRVGLPPHRHAPVSRPGQARRQGSRGYTAQGCASERGCRAS